MINYCNQPCNCELIVNKFANNKFSKFEEFKNIWKVKRRKIRGRKI